MQRPRVPPIIELGRQVQRVETRRYVSDDPEDEPHGRPGLTDDHGDVLAGETQGDHAHAVDHPVDDKGAFTIGFRVLGDLGGGGAIVGERDLKSQRDEGVGKGEEEIGRDGGGPAPYDEV